MQPYNVIVAGFRRVVATLMLSILFTPTQSEPEKVEHRSPPGQVGYYVPSIFEISRIRMEYGIGQIRLHHMTRDNV